MKVKEIVDLLHSPYTYIDKDLYRTEYVPEDIGNKEVKFMYIATYKVKNLCEDQYLAIVTKE